MIKRKIDPRDVLDDVTLHLIESQEDIDRFNRIIEQEHYLKNCRLAGKVIRHVALYQGEWIGLMCWSAAAYHLKARDNWIGWSDDQRRARLNLIGSNSRFLLRMDPGEVPNLATRIMRLSLQRLSGDWLKMHAHGLLAVETFVDPQLYHGGCYKAGGWLELGFTAGYQRKGRDYYEAHGNPKRLFVKELRKNARELLRRAEMPQLYREGQMSARPVCRFKVPELGSLFEVFNTMKDPRRKAGRRYPLGCVLGIIAAAVISGARDMQAISDFATGLSPQQRRRLRCWKNQYTGCFHVPSKTTFWNVMTVIDASELDKRLGRWLAGLAGNRAEALAIDGKTVKGAWSPQGRQLHLFAAFCHDASVVYSQCAVDEKSNEITHVEKLLDSIVIDGKVVTADALHTQRRTANYLVQERGADYLFTIKENQPTLLAKAQQLLPTSFFFREETASDQGPWTNRKSPNHLQSDRA